MSNATTISRLAKKLILPIIATCTLLAYPSARLKTHLGKSSLSLDQFNKSISSKIIRLKFHVVSPTFSTHRQRKLMLLFLTWTRQRLSMTGKSRLSMLNVLLPIKCSAHNTKIKQCNISKIVVACTNSTAMDMIRAIIRTAFTQREGSLIT